jgi:uncharacterized protein (DUF302 family)
MSYYFKKVLKNTNFEQALEAVRESLQAEGFGIVSDLDMQATLKNKLDIDFRKYRILGACNPPFAYRSLNTEAAIGTLLPCNVVVQEKNEHDIEIDIIDPLAAMQAVDSDEMKEIAEEIHSKLEKALNSLPI